MLKNLLFREVWPQLLSSALLTWLPSTWPTPTRSSSDVTPFLTSTFQTYFLVDLLKISFIFTILIRSWYKSNFQIIFTWWNCNYCKSLYLASKIVASNYQIRQSKNSFFYQNAQLNHNYRGSGNFPGNNMFFLSLVCFFLSSIFEFFLFLLFIRLTRRIGTLVWQIKMLKVASRNFLIKDKYFTALQTNYYFWPIYNFLNFKYVSLLFRIFAINMGAYFWNVYMSYINSK